MPRVGLTPAAVTEEAARVSDEHGFAALSLAAVAKRLGVAVPSLYKHVRGLGGLRREVAIASAREFGDVLGRAAIGRSGADAVRSVAAAYRAWARAHPGRYAALNLAPEQSDEEAAQASFTAVEVMIGVVRGFNIPEESVIDVIRALRSALHGFVDLEARGGFGLPQSIDTSFTVLLDGLIGVLKSWPKPMSQTVE